MRIYCSGYVEDTDWVAGTALPCFNIIATKCAGEKKRSVMYSYRGYSASSKASQQQVTENGTMGRHTSSSPPPVLSDGKRRSIRDRLQGITSAMSWIKDELVSRGREGEGEEGSGRREREREERATSWFLFCVLARSE